MDAQCAKCTIELMHLNALTVVISTIWLVIYHIYVAIPSYPRIETKHRRPCLDALAPPERQRQSSHIKRAQRNKNQWTYEMTGIWQGLIHTIRRPPYHLARHCSTKSRLGFICHQESNHHFC